MKSSSNTHCLISWTFDYKNLKKRKTSIDLAFQDFRKVLYLVDYDTVIKKAISMGLHPSVAGRISDAAQPGDEVSTRE